MFVQCGEVFETRQGPGHQNAATFLVMAERECPGIMVGQERRLVILL